MKLQLLNEMIGKYDEYDEIQHRLHERQQLKSNIDSLNTAVVRMANTLDQFDVLLNNSCGYLPSLDAATFNALQATVQRCKNDLSQQKLQGSNLNEFSQLSVQLAEQLKTRWQSWINAAAQEVIDFLNAIEPLLKNPYRSNQLRVSLEALKKQWPIKAQDLEAFKNNVAEGRKIISELGASQTVMDFLTLVYRQSATLEDLNEEILTWLRSHQFESKMTVRFVKAGGH